MFDTSSVPPLPSRTVATPAPAPAPVPAMGTSTTDKRPRRIPANYYRAPVARTRPLSVVTTIDGITRTISVGYLAVR